MWEAKTYQRLRYRWTRRTVSAAVLAFVAVVSTGVDGQLLLSRQPGKTALAVILIVLACGGAGFITELLAMHRRAPFIFFGIGVVAGAIGFVILALDFSSTASAFPGVSSGLGVLVSAALFLLAGCAELLELKRLRV
jgi:hypothetical protein